MADRGVYASTAAVSSPRDLWEILDEYGNAGLRAVELGYADLTDAEHLVPRLRSLGLDYVVHNYFPPPAEPFVLNLASADGEVAHRSLELVLAALDLSAELDAPFYSVHCGWITEPIGFDGTSFILPEPDPGAAPQARKRFVDALAVAVARAEQLGLSLLVENSVCTEDLRGKLLLLEASDLATLFEELDSRALGLLLDTGHLNVTARTLGFDRVAFVDALALRIRAWHVHDNDGVADLHRPVAPGSWVHQLLLRPEFAASPVTVEAKFADAVALADHVDWLRRARADGARLDGSSTT